MRVLHRVHLPSTFKLKRKNKFRMSGRESDVSEDQLAITQVVRSYHVKAEDASEEQERNEEAKEAEAPGVWAGGFATPSRPSDCDVVVVAAGAAGVEGDCDGNKAKRLDAQVVRLRKLSAKRKAEAETACREVRNLREDLVDLIADKAVLTEDLEALKAVRFR